MAEVREALPDAAGDVLAETFTSLLGGGGAYQMPEPLPGASSGAQLANAYQQGFTAGTTTVLTSSSKSYQAGFDHGYKESQKTLKACGLPQNVSDSKQLKRKCKLVSLLQ